MSTQWHYADRQQQQQGPVDATWLQAAYARGEVDAGSLVWREGLAEWQPLARVAAELGIALPAPPSMQARKPVVVAPGGGSSALLIVLIVGVALVAVLGILAAIAIPAYQDYSQRARIMQGLARAMPVKLAVQEFKLENDRCPVNEEGDIGPASSYAEGALQAIHVGALEDTPEHCEIQLLYLGVGRAGEQDTLSLIYRGPNDWGYRSTLPARSLPPSIRAQVESGE